MSKTSSTKGVQDDLKYLTLSFQPFTTHTVATLVSGSSRSGGPVDRFLARWHLSITRADLAGHSTSDALHVLVDMVVHRLRTGGDPADRYATDSDAQPVGSGAPLGATGGTVGQDSLPGL
jgi:hypothetical protein